LFIIGGVMTTEEHRLKEAHEQNVLWKKWGPYLSERQWGTVREDYSDNGDAWNYFTHDQARSRAYHWGEDGIGGICDNHQVMCFALALWNGKDPILKERLFGLANSEGNHGEDVKEYYFYLDSTPTHSYMKYLYKYPQGAYPYQDLISTNKNRGYQDHEYELINTGIFNDNRYFDVFVEYAKESPEDVLIKISIANRGPETSTLHVLPTLWYRNTWSWIDGGSKPVLKGIDGNTYNVIHAHHTDPLFQESLVDYDLYCEGNAPLLFTENETNNERLFGTPNVSPYVKDGINNYIVHGKTEAVNLNRSGTKASAHYTVTIESGQSQVIKMRLTTVSPANLSAAYSYDNPFGSHFDEIFDKRLQEADEFYASVYPPNTSEDERSVMRQALAGMLWSKQYFYFDLNLWLKEHNADPSTHPSKRRQIRNQEWFHMVNDDIISMPDKWEYPWYAAWDLAFHMVAFQMVDLDFAKEQLELMLSARYLHPSGQVPAYEWNFSDVNPPVHAWATYFIYEMDKAKNNGKGDINFLKSAFLKLMLNFTWWVNRKDIEGNNLFQGGFLGLDNIGVFDRSSPLPTGGHLEQSDGTAWMVFYCQTMLQIVLELTLHDSSFEEILVKFVEHAFWIAGSMDRIGDNQDELWDEEDGFFYDVLRFPDGSATRLKVRSMVGLLPLCATTVFPKIAERLPKVAERLRWFINKHPELVANIHPITQPGLDERKLFCVLNEKKLRRVLAYMLDEKEFLSPYGIRSLSRFHLEHPYVFHYSGQSLQVAYEPAESTSGMFGGNSNWRGPIWLPVNGLLIRALLQLYSYYGDEFKVECPTGSGQLMTLYQVAEEISRRLIRIFLKDKNGRRPVYGSTGKFQQDPDWNKHILFYEYFHGENGAGIGASHQTGWTGIVASLIQSFGSHDMAQSIREGGVIKGRIKGISKK